MLDTLVVANLDGALPPPADFSPANTPATVDSTNKAIVLSILKARADGRGENNAIVRVELETPRCRRRRCPRRPEAQIYKFRPRYPWATSRPRMPPLF